MRTRPVQAWGGGRQRVKKKIRGRQAGGLGSEAMHVCNEEREKAASKCVRLCLCACVLSLSSFLCLSTEWKKAERIKKDKRGRGRAGAAEGKV